MNLLLIYAQFKEFMKYLKKIMSGMAAIISFGKGLENLDLQYTLTAIKL